MDYSVIPLATIPEETRGRPQKWLKILDELDTSNALMFKLNDRKSAEHVRSNILGCFRMTRAKRLGIHYKVRTRLIHDTDNLYTVYAWKEQVPTEGSK